MLEIGQTISHYKILEKIGRGGMGVVYKARDTRLNRFAAIKTLSQDRVVDQERQRRFIREAQSASALNHPNIITIYEVDSTGPVAFIAMEYVKGRTMKEAIPGNGLSVGQALKYAVQIVDALSALHSEGIVHRDLKPANIMVGESGGLKVLDFGLAKLTEVIEGGNNSRETTADQTEEGIVLGTLPYMSPEQIEGRPVDVRSDIFSFGVLLYEMITGQLPFRGGSKSSIAAAILREDPVPVTQIKSSLPPAVERTVSRCLEKDRQRRFQHAADLKFALEWLAQDIDSGRLGPMVPGNAVQASRGRGLLLVLMISVLVLAAVVAGLYRFRTRTPPTADLKRVTSDLGLTTNPALSPDGNLLAYGSDRSGEGNLDIWLQQIAGGQPIRRTSDPTDEENPKFSPDSSSIVFTKEGGGVFVIPSLAGEEMQVAPSGLDPRFSPDGARIAYWIGDQDNPAPSGKVYITSIGRGEATQVGAEFADARFPLWSPDGKSILFQGIRFLGEDPEWWVVPVKPGPAINTGILSSLRKKQLSPIPGPGDWMGNHLAFSGQWKENRHVWIATITIPGFRLSSPIRQVTFGTGMEGEPSLNPNGEMAVAGWHYQNNLWRISLEPGKSGKSGFDRLSRSGAFDTHPSASADGKKLAFLSRGSGTRQVWIRDLRNGKESRLTIGAGEKSAPVISPDGSQVAYSVEENGSPSIYVLAAETSRPGTARRVCEKCGIPSDWMPDLSGILYTAGLPLCVYRLDLASGSSVPVLRHPGYNLDQPHISRNGRWIAFVAGIGAERSQIFLCPVENSAKIPPTQWIAITDGQSWDDKPRWLDWDSLIYFSNRDRFGCIWKQRLKPDTMEIAGTPQAVHHFHELRRSPRTLRRSDFEIAVVQNFIILNIVELTGNIWLTSIPLEH